MSLARVACQNLLFCRVPINSILGFGLRYLSLPELPKILQQEVLAVKGKHETLNAVDLKP